ncbi:MAG TPA: hypothetical protein VME66_12285, partial [Candidatus Acidoferrales bacterium]|nr:hypothetical protein [Candidatus Acidoferrales bacterium]
MKSSPRNVLCFLALAGMAGCAGAGSTPPSLRTAQSLTVAAPNTSLPTPSNAPCPVAIVQAPTMYVPAPGATNVPTTPGTLIIADSLARFHTPYLAALTPANGGPTILTSLFTRFRGPSSSSGIGVPAHTRLAAAQYPQLSPGTTYQIVFERAATNCPITAPVAGFTTAGTRPTPPQTPTTTPTPISTNCPVSSPAPGQLLLTPRDQSTNVSPNIGLIYVAGPIASLSLQPPTGPPIITLTIIDPTAVEHSFKIPTLAANTLYRVTATDTSAPGCPGFQTSIGSFT